MKSYYARGGLGALSALLPAQAPAPASFYTYGTLPQEVWPASNPPPVPQAQTDYEDQMFGDDEQHGQQQLAEGGMPIPEDAGALGAMLGGGGAPYADGAVAGPGTGRSDDIDARLSDGEYVLDAETVALLGDGSTAAGAQRLDEMREALRRHKGATLAKGKFSPPAKSPIEYLMSGER